MTGILRLGRSLSAHGRLVAGKWCPRDKYFRFKIWGVGYDPLVLKVLACDNNSVVWELGICHMLDLNWGDKSVR